MANKKVLIISPYFPPDNAADMHRIRISIPYFEENGWEAEVVAVHPNYTDAVKDPALLHSLPAGIKIHHVKAWSKKRTARIGLGSLAIRSLWFYYTYVNELLKIKKFDLIYFSTTQFPVLILGTYWKSRFSIKIIFDIQDPWHTDYYKKQPRAERPKKYWFSYHLNRLLEPIAIKASDGLISVSTKYVETLKDRYPKLKDCPAMVIPFGMNLIDLEISRNKLLEERSILPLNGKKHMVYAGRGGHDLKPAIKLLFAVLKSGLKEHPEYFASLQLHFIGTSYAAPTEAKKIFTDIINEYGLKDMVFEIAGRIPFYQTLNTLRNADLLFIPGPDQTAYTASKLFPYIMAQKPILSIMHAQSTAREILKDSSLSYNLNLSQSQASITLAIYRIIKSLYEEPIKPIHQLSAFEKYSAAHFTKKQTEIFNAVCIPAL